MLHKLMYAANLALQKADTPDDLDCCVVNRDMLAHAFSLGAAVFNETPAWMIYRDADDYVPADRVFGPVDAAIRLGIATPADVMVVGETYQVQVWSTLRPDGRAGPLSSGDRGHTFIWHEVAPGIGFIIESDRFNGMRFRGPVKWADIAKFRKHIKYAKLRKIAAVAGARDGSG